MGNIEFFSDLQCLVQAPGNDRADLAGLARIHSMNESGNYTGGRWNALSEYYTGMIKYLERISTIVPHMTAGRRCGMLSICASKYNWHDLSIGHGQKSIVVEKMRGLK